MLHRILLIAKRDYMAVVMTKAFVIGLVVLPLMMGSGFFGLALMRVTQGNSAKRVAIIDHTGIAAGAIIRAAERKAAADKADKIAAPQLAANNYTFEEIKVDESGLAAERLALSDRVRNHSLSAFIEVDRNALERSQISDKTRGKVGFYADSGNIGAAQGWLIDAIDKGLLQARLARDGLDERRFDDAFRDVPVESMSLISRDAKTGAIRGGHKNSPVEAAVPIVLMILMMLMTLLGAASMLSVVAEDKMQRVFEMLLASATPFELMAGKILASVGTSLTSSVFYITGGLLVMSGMSVIGMARLDLLPWFFVYIVCQVTMLSALGAALGSACSVPRDAQQLTPLVILPIMAPVILIAPLIQEPNGMFTTAVSFFPPFTPAVMMMRQAMPGGVPAWQPWTGLAGVVLWALALTWAAARVFRVGLLMQGQTPRLPELVRWVVRG
jgi:ABC-2 type transport system permease protein